MHVGSISWGCMASCQRPHETLGSHEPCRLQMRSIRAGEAPQMVLDALQLLCDEQLDLTSAWGRNQQGNQ